MNSRIEMPPQPSINLHWLLLRIADAIVPDLASAKGIHCIVGKSMAFPPSLTRLRSGLEAAERKALEDILPDLPPIHAEMPPAELNRFLNAYAKHPKRATWVPVVAGPEDVFDNRSRRIAVMDSHRRSLTDLFNSGLIRCVNSAHMPVSVFDLSHLILRDDAERYLVEHGLAASSATVAGIESTPEAKKPAKRPRSSYTEEDKAAMLKDQEELGRSGMMAKWRLPHNRDAAALIGPTPKGRKRMETAKRKAKTFLASIKSLAKD